MLDTKNKFARRFFAETRSILPETSQIITLLGKLNKFVLTFFFLFVIFDCK